MIMAAHKLSSESKTENIYFKILFFKRGGMQAKERFLNGDVAQESVIRIEGLDSEMEGLANCWGEGLSSGQLDKGVSVKFKEGEEPEEGGPFHHLLKFFIATFHYVPGKKYGRPEMLSR